MEETNTLRQRAKQNDEITGSTDHTESSNAAGAAASDATVSGATAAGATAAGEEEKNDSSFECNICLDIASDAVISLCGHLFW